MTPATLFCHLSSKNIAEIINGAEVSVCYAAPGIQPEPAKALIDVAKNIGTHMTTISLDFDENVMRMGYGDMFAIEAIRRADIHITHVSGLRSGLLIVDNEGYSFTPTPLYLEAESNNERAFNALRLSREQRIEALARLSPAAKSIAIAQAQDETEKQRLADVPVEVDAKQVTTEQFRQVSHSLQEAPPVKFDLARRVRVFESYLQYVELSLTGAAIQRHRLAIPASIQKLGGKELEGRLRTTFDLIEKDSKLSSKALEKDLAEIRKNFTPSLGKQHGRVILKAAKPHFEDRLETFRGSIKSYQEKIKDELEQHLSESRAQVIKYYLPHVLKTPPDALLGQILGPLDEKVAAAWLDRELERVFPKAELLVNEIKLDIHYKDVTFETLNGDEFLDSIQSAFPDIDWKKAYKEFQAAGEEAA